MKYQIGQEFNTKYGSQYTIINITNQSYEIRVWSGSRHVGDLSLSEKDLDCAIVK